MSLSRTLAMNLPPGQSAFPWGGRQTGKSTYLRERFPHSIHFDLQDFDTRFRLSANPSRRDEELQAASPDRFAAEP